MRPLLLSIFLAGAGLILAGCANHREMHTQTLPDAAYKAALERTDPSVLPPPPEGSEAEREMLRRFEDLFSDYSRETIEANFDAVYAAELYFRDAFRGFSSSAEVKAYLLHGLEPLEKCEFVFNRIVRSGGEFYVDWTMRLDFKNTPSGTWEESIGMTHVRFNEAGKVVFHQDYWDPTDIVYRRIPIARSLIAYVKARM
jgi:hypothetical protein